MDWIRNNHGLAFALLLAAVLRVLWLDAQCFNMDEMSELTTARTSVSTIIPHADSMPPGYSLLLKGWLEFWDTDQAARWLSVIFGVASVACVAVIGRELVDARTGAAAACVTAILPLHIYFSQFVRVYSMFFFMAALALWLLLLAARRGGRAYWMGFVVAAVVGTYLHYYFAIVLATSLVVLMVDRRTWRIGREAVGAYAVVGLCVVPLLLLVPADLALQKHAIPARPLGIGAFGFTYLTFFTGGSLGPSSGDLHEMPLREAALQMVPWAAAIGLVILLIGYDGWKTVRARGASGALLTLLLLPPLVVGAIGYAFDVTYHFRFVVWCMIPAAIWLGAGLAHHWRSPRVQLGLVAMVFICGLALFNRNFVPRYQNEDLRGAARYLVAHAQPDEPVFVVSDYLMDVLGYYMAAPLHVVELPRPGEVSHAVETADDLDEALAAIASASENSSYWLVYGRPFHGDPERKLLTRLQSDDAAQMVHEFAGVALYRGAQGSCHEPARKSEIASTLSHGE